MSAPAHGQDSERRLCIVLAFAFGCVCIAVVLALAFKGSSLDDRQFEILRIVLALAGGGVGGVIPGFLDLNMKAGAKLALHAGGGLAVFVVLYFWSPAHWVTGSVSQHTDGANSPAINGNGNAITIGGCSPAINGSGNHVDVDCKGVDPRVMARIDELFDRLQDLEASVAKPKALNAFSALGLPATPVGSTDWAKMISSTSPPTLLASGTSIATTSPPTLPLSGASIAGSR